MTHRPLASRPPRSGFSLVEVVVATSLLAVAALGVATTATAAAHLAATSRALERATRTTARIVDSLRSTPCRAIIPGSSASAVGTVSWTVTSHPGVVSISASLVPASPRVRALVAEEALFPCD